MNSRATDPQLLEPLLERIGCEYEFTVSESVVPVADLAVSGLSADSRSLLEGEAFIALPGETSHGVDYLADVEDRATVVLLDAGDQQSKNLSTHLPLLRVQGLPEKMGDLVSQFHGNPSHDIPVCGVTGTDGKTSVSQFVAGILQAMGKPTGFIGTVGWGMGDKLAPNPLTTPSMVDLHRMLAELREQGAEFIVMEVSSHALVQGRVQGVWFDVAALTNLGRDHLDYHKTEANYRAAKKKLFDWNGLAAVVVNLDDVFGRELFAECKAAGRAVCAYTIDGGHETVVDSEATAHSNSLPTVIPAESLLRATNIVSGNQGVSFMLHAGSSQWQVTTSLLGKFNVSNLLAATGIVRAFGEDVGAAIATFDKLVCVPGRMEAFRKSDMPTLVVDFAHTAQALESALTTVREHCDAQLWLVFGCGGDRDRGKRSEMGEVAFANADQVIVTDDNPRSESSSKIIADILSGIAAPALEAKESSGQIKMADSGNRVFVEPDRKSAIEFAFENAAVGDWILIAGKGHEDYQLVGDKRLPFSDRVIARDLLGGSAL